MWFLAQLEGVSEAYHIPIGLRLTGAINESGLIDALSALVSRHEALRTTFYTIDGEVFQRIGPADMGFALKRFDLGDAGDVSAHIQEEARSPFDLEHGPLIRGRLIRTGDEEHVLLITMHHIVSDGWSMGVLTQELSVSFAAFGRGESDLPPLAIHNSR